MKTDIGEVFFIHPRVFQHNYLDKSDVPGAVRIDRIHPSTYRVDGRMIVVVSDLEPATRTVMASEPTAETRRHFEKIGWPWVLGWGR